MSTPAENIEAIRELLGPKRVKTPKIEVEQFDLDQLDRIAQKSNTFRPSFDNFMFAVASPKCDPRLERLGINCDCTDEYDDCSYNGGSTSSNVQTESINIESLSGTINGTNTIFTTTHSFSGSQIQVYLNGVLQRITIDYTLSNGNTVTFVQAPQLGDSLSSLYKKA